MSEIALIPVMTSDTTPSGEVTYSSRWTASGNYQGYFAFDGNNSTYWAAGAQASDEWLAYEFSSPQKVIALFIDAGNEGSSSDSYKLQYYNGSTWIDLTEYRPYGNGVSEKINISNPVTASKYRVIFGGISTHNTRTLQLYGTDKTPHIKSTGDMNAVKDWLNASLYNKEEIDNLFIEKNQTGLAAYDLLITSPERDKYVKLVGQTSGQIYNVCLAGILGDDMKETVLWTNPGSTNPSTITLNDDISNYKLIIICTNLFADSTNYIDSFIFSPSYISNVSETPKTLRMGRGNGYLCYTVTSERVLTLFSAAQLIGKQIIGYK